MEEAYHAINKKSPTKGHLAKIESPKLLVVWTLKKVDHLRFCIYVNDMYIFFLFEVARLTRWCVESAKNVPDGNAS